MEQNTVRHAGRGAENPRTVGRRHPAAMRRMGFVTAAIACVVVAGAASADSINDFSVKHIAPNARAFSFDYNYKSSHGSNVYLGVEVRSDTDALIWYGYQPVKAVRDVIPFVDPEFRATITTIYAYNNPPASARSKKIRVIMYEGGQAPFFSQTFDYDSSWWVPNAYPTLWTPEIKVHCDWDISRGDSRYQRARETIQALNDRLYDATDGQVRLGKVTFYDRNSHVDPEGHGVIHFHLNWPSTDSHHGSAGGVAHGSTGRPGDPQHAHLRLMPTLTQARQYGGTALMEFLHSWTGLKDEYETENGSASACPKNGDRQWDTCLMDDTSRTELCKSWNHNPLTEQGTFRDMDCWSWLKSIMHEDLGADLINLPVYLPGPTDAPDPTIEVAVLRVQVTTADVSWAGTDDNVYFRLNGREYQLDTPGHDDFERDHTDTFFLPVPEGMQVSDIQSLQIRKSSDGIAGGWKLGGLRVYLDGVPVYVNNSINTWLEDDDRTWGYTFPTIRFLGPQLLGVIR